MTIFRAPCYMVIILDRFISEAVGVVEQRFAKAFVYCVEHLGFVVSTRAVIPIAVVR